LKHQSSNIEERRRLASEVLEETGYVLSLHTTPPTNNPLPTRESLRLLEGVSKEWRRVNSLVAEGGKRRREEMGVRVKRDNLNNNLIYTDRLTGKVIEGKEYERRYWRAVRGLEVSTISPTTKKRRKRK